MFFFPHHPHIVVQGLSVNSNYQFLNSSSYVTDHPLSSRSEDSSLSSQEIKLNQYNSFILNSTLDDHEVIGLH